MPRSNIEIKDYNDNYNKDDGGLGGSVVNNNTANLVTITSALMDLSRGKEEDIRTRKKVDNGAYFNHLSMPLRLDHIRNFYVDYLHTYFLISAYLIFVNFDISI